MKKLGFLDYYLDEWHANHYVDWLRDASQGEVQAVYAYGQINSPHPGGKTTEEWCARYGRSEERRVGKECRYRWSR